MVAALKARREALEEKVREKRALLKEICIKEGELTGELPPEIPLAPGEPLPLIRRRIGTEFQISERLLNTAASPEEEQLAQLELELEIQSKVRKSTVMKKKFYRYIRYLLCNSVLSSLTAFIRFVSDVLIFAEFYS